MFVIIYFFEQTKRPDDFWKPKLSMIYEKCMHVKHTQLPLHSLSLYTPAHTLQTLCNPIYTLCRILSFLNPLINTYLLKLFFFFTHTCKRYLLLNLFTLFINPYTLKYIFILFYFSYLHMDMAMDTKTRTHTNTHPQTHSHTNTHIVFISFVCARFPLLWHSTWFGPFPARSMLIHEIDLKHKNLAI